MKNVKVIFASIGIITILLASVNFLWVNADNVEGEVATIGMFTTQEAPNPKGW